MAKSQSILATRPSSTATRRAPALIVPPVSFLGLWSVRLIGATVVVGVGLIIFEFVLLKRVIRPRQVAAHEVENTDTDAATRHTEKALTTKPTEEVAIRPDAVRGDPLTLPQTKPMPMTEPKKPVRPSEPVLTVLGGLTTAHLYQSYLNIGLIADGVANNIYESEDGKELLDTLGKVMDTVERQLAQLPEAELQPEEKNQLEKVLAVLSLLRSEVKELKSYWDTGAEENVRSFQKIHKNVWSELEKLLGGE